MKETGSKREGDGGLNSCNGRADGGCVRTRPRHGATGRGGIAALVLLGTAVVLTGCHGQQRWEYANYPEVQRRAAAEGKLTLVYFKSWYRIESTRFEEDVLEDPAVRDALDGMARVMLDRDYDQELAQRWGLTKVPSYAIISPEGDVLVRDQAPITRDALLKGIRKARQIHSGTEAGS